MTILNIETSTMVCSVAITVNGVPIVERISYDGGNHAKLLPVFIDELLKEIHKQKLQLDAVALSEGPGSYTGLRIGTSTAKGICYGKQIPLIPIPTLQVLAASYIAQNENGCSLNEAILCPMLDARRMEVYVSLYDASLKPITDVKSWVVENDEWLENLGKVVYYFGDGATKCQNILQSSRVHFVSNIVPEAKYMGKLAEQRITNGYKGADVAYFEPFYLKDFVAAPSHVKGLK